MREHIVAPGNVELVLGRVVSLVEQRVKGFENERLALFGVGLGRSSSWLGLCSNQAPPATAAALIKPNAASAAANAMNAPVTSPVQRKASQPPHAAIMRRARLARNGHSNRPAPCEAK